MYLRENAKLLNESSKPTLKQESYTLFLNLKRQWGKYLYITKLDLDVAHNKVQTSSGVTQSFNRWVPGIRRPRRTLTIYYVQLTPRFRMNGTAPPTTPSSTGAQRDKFTCSTVHNEIQKRTITNITTSLLQTEEETIKHAENVSESEVSCCATRKVSNNT